MRDLITFISKYDTQYQTKIAGAYNEEIAKLEELSGCFLPPVYKEFLQYLGKSMGGILPPEIDLSIDRVLKFYEVSKRKPPAHYLFIGAQTEDPYDKYFLDINHTVDNDCPVITADISELFETDDHLWPYFPSLKDMLFVHAFICKRIELLPFRRSFYSNLERGDDGRLDVPANLMSIIIKGMYSLGFQRLPYTSELNPIFEKGDAAFYASQSAEGWGIGAELAAASEKEFERLINNIYGKTGMV